MEGIVSVKCKPPELPGCGSKKRRIRYPGAPKPPRKPRRGQKIFLSPSALQPRPRKKEHVAESHSTAALLEEGASLFSFGPCTARFLFSPRREKRKWGVHFGPACNKLETFAPAAQPRTKDPRGRRPHPPKEVHP